MHLASVGRIALAGIQLAGLIISALIVGVTFSNPDQVEERLRQIAVAKVERFAEKVWSEGAFAPAEGSRFEKLTALSDRIGVDVEAYEARRKEIVPAILALAKSETCKQDCEFWVAASKVTDIAIVEHIARLRLGQSTVSDVLVERYETSVQGLLMDLRRFGLVNVVVLALMLGLVVFQNHLNWRFNAFSVALTGYTAWAAYGYLYSQNWALSILLQDWASPSYQISMILFACLLFDWLFLRGRITEATTNMIVSILPG